MTSYVHDTPVFRPTKEEFSKPFCEYIKKVLKKNPDVAMFKVIPPEGWRPRRTPFPKLQKLDIQVPIKQLVFGTRGSYRCMLVEQKPLTAHEFRDIAEDDEHVPPKGEKHKDDKLLERAFWSSVTINPPLYGADTPMSFFDEKLPYGWNLRDLGCLLKRPEVPQVPGVTTPMTYFGMWKSFFAWHVEDADLFSINYLHFGAPKVWYCVSPKDRAKFERMAQSMFPELHKHCPAFMRHKDILLSPSLLKNYGVEYMQATQEPNEFIILNAGAYHAGYNTGFNCAEAVNFATDDWIDIGRNVVRCKCDALAEGVRISMRLFGCSSGSSASTDEEDSGSEETEASDSESDSDEPESEEVESAEKAKKRIDSRSGKQTVAAAASTPKSAAAKRSAAVAAASPPSASKRSRTESVAAVSPSAPVKKGPRQTKTSLAAAAAASKMRRTHATAEARARLAVAHGRVAKDKGKKPGSSGVKKATIARIATPARVINKAETLEESLQRAAAAAAAMRARAEAALAAAAESQQQQESVKQEQQHKAHVKQEQQEQEQAVKDEPGVLTRRSSSGTNIAAAADTTPTAAAAAGSEPESPRAAKAQLQAGGQLDAAAAAAGGSDSAPVGDAPQVIIGEDNGKKHFYMVQVLRDTKPKQRGRLVMRWLKEGRDGLFRPSSDTWEETPGALVRVRTQWVAASTGRTGGYRLLTLRSRILETELED